jgi:hypothetical protein
MKITATREEMKARALALMESIGIGEDFIEALRTEDEVGMSEQWIKSKEDAIPDFGGRQKRTYLDREGALYDVYPYVYGLPEVHEARKKFEEEYGYFVYHMHYMTNAFLGAHLTMLYLPNCDFTAGEDDENQDVAGCWDGIESWANNGGWLPAYVAILRNENASFFCEIAFCTTDNGCFMRLS